MRSDEYLESRIDVSLVGVGSWQKASLALVRALLAGAMTKDA